MGIKIKKLQLIYDEIHFQAHLFLLSIQTRALKKRWLVRRSCLWLLACLSTYINHLAEEEREEGRTEGGRELKVCVKQSETKVCSKYNHHLRFCVPLA